MGETGKRCRSRTRRATARPCGSIPEPRHEHGADESDDVILDPLVADVRAHELGERDCSRPTSPISEPNACSTSALHGLRAEREVADTHDVDALARPCRLAVCRPPIERSRRTLGFRVNLVAAPRGHSGRVEDVMGAIALLASDAAGRLVERDGDLVARDRPRTCRRICRWRAHRRAVCHVKCVP